jgi:hypothetical protein
VKVTGSYERDGFAFVESAIPPLVANALLTRIRMDLERSGTPLDRFARGSDILSREAIELSAEQYTPLATFLWGLTPIMTQITGRDLVPTYDYFRIYRRGDICRVHADRPACEHSMSLTLGYSDDLTWPLEIATTATPPEPDVEQDFGDQPFTSLPMKPGDAVAYQGIPYRHGRIAPNPNRWSAHLFMHWVAPDGPHADQAFDGKLDARERPHFDLP